MKTLKQMTYEYTIFTLQHFEGNRTRACESLDISMRTMRNYIAEIRVNPNFKNLVDVVDKPELMAHGISESKIICKIFPTNEERLKYLDTFPNRCGPRGSIYD